MKDSEMADLLQKFIDANQLTDKDLFNVLRFIVVELRFRDNKNTKILENIATLIRELE